MLLTHCYEVEIEDPNWDLPGPWALPLERGVMEIGAGRPGMFRGNELITFGPGLVLGFPTLCGVVEVFIFIGGGTKTVRT